MLAGAAGGIVERACAGLMGEGADRRGGKDPRAVHDDDVATDQE